MKILITGAQGQLGRTLHRLLQETGEVFALDRQRLDIADAKQVLACLFEVRPDYIINCAAYNKVDLAQKQREDAFAVNFEGIKNLADGAAEQTHIIHLSTDYVFDGNKKTPYLETDETNPLSVYGQSKKAGEDYLLAHCEHAAVVRTAWLYSIHTGNFCRTVVDRLRQGTPLRIVSDQIGSPTSVEDLSRQLLVLMKERAFGLFHASAQGACSWYDYAEAIRRRIGISQEITAISTTELREENPGIRADRPSYSVLANARLQQLGIDTMSPWDEELAKILKSIL